MISQHKSLVPHHVPEDMSIVILTTGSPGQPSWGHSIEWLLNGYPGWQAAVEVVEGGIYNLLQSIETVGALISLKMKYFM